MQHCLWFEDEPHCVWPNFLSGNNFFFEEGPFDILLMHHHNCPFVLVIKQSHCMCQNWQQQHCLNGNFLLVPHCFPHFCYQWWCCYKIDSFFSSSLLMQLPTMKVISVKTILSMQQKMLMAKMMQRLTRTMNSHYDVHQHSICFHLCLMMLMTILEALVSQWWWRHRAIHQQEQCCHCFQSQHLCRTMSCCCWHRSHCHCYHCCKHHHLKMHWTLNCALLSEPWWDCVQWITFFVCWQDE